MDALLRAEPGWGDAGGGDVVNARLVGEGDGLWGESARLYGAGESVCAKLGERGEDGDRAFGGEFVSGLASGWIERRLSLLEVTARFNASGAPFCR